MESLMSTISKKAFITQKLRKNPTATFAVVNAAWVAKHDGTLSGPHFYRLRKQVQDGTLSEAKKPKKPSKKIKPVPSFAGFVRECFAREPSISAADAQALWKKAGYPGELPKSAVYGTRHQPRAAEATPKPTAKSEAHQEYDKRRRKAAAPEPSLDPTSLDEIEANLDRLIIMAKALGESPLERSLRRARQYCCAAIVETL
jgi:hypothetical protein